MVPSFEEPHQPPGGKLIKLDLFYLEEEAIHLDWDISSYYGFTFPGYWVSANLKSCRVFGLLMFGLR